MSEKKLAIIATKGSLDWAYPPFILASTAAALGYEVEIFCTFYGLQLLRKKMDLKVTSLGNPGMPMPMPMPVLLQALPGMQSMMTMMMKQKIIEAEVRLVACQMTVDLFDFNTSDFIDGIEYGGAATFFEFKKGAVPRNCPFFLR